MREQSAVPADDRGTRAALTFALAAQRLSAYYEHGQWLTDAQGASLAAEWLARSKRSMPLDERRRLSALSDEFARGIAGSLSRPAGLQAAHEMMEALDANYHSELAEALMAACTQFIDRAPVADSAADSAAD